MFESVKVAVKANKYLSVLSVWYFSNEIVKSIKDFFSFQLEGSLLSRWLGFAITYNPSNFSA